jgi:hypothetical protein
VDELHRMLPSDILPRFARERVRIGVNLIKGSARVLALKGGQNSAQAAVAALWRALV